MWLLWFEVEQGLRQSPATTLLQWTRKKPWEPHGTMGLKRTELLRQCLIEAQLENRPPAWLELPNSQTGATKVICFLFLWPSTRSAPIALGETGEITFTVSKPLKIFNSNIQSSQFIIAFLSSQVQKCAGYCDPKGALWFSSFDSCARHPLTD